jgi:type VI protein secretion system component Hcp
MKKNLYRIAILTAFTLTTLAASAAPIYMDFGDIKGEANPTARDSRKEPIQLESWSLGASPSSTGNVVQGNLIGTDAASACSTGAFKFAVRGADAESVKKLCQSHARLGNVTVDINGVKHRFESATFASCQNGDGTIPTDQFSLNFTKCTFHRRGGVSVALGDLTGDGATQSNARLIGLNSGPVPVRLDSLKLAADGKSATVGLTKVGTGTLTLSSANNTDQLVLEMTNGTKWTFTKVTFGDLVISSATPGRGAKPIEPFTLNFAKVEGPVAGFTR